MDFIDELRALGKRIEKMKNIVTTEESTKNAMVLPFFQILGYDVFDPSEFVPEFTADVGIKKGEKIDYAIFENEVPTIFVECKWCGATLDRHDSQLFRYYGTNQTAKFAILTNGIIYRFYTDLDNKNVMDLIPFMELDLLDINESTVLEVKKFHKSNFDASNLQTTASELRYTNLIKALLAKQANDPDDEFVKYILKEIYDGLKTTPVIERFKSIVKASFNSYVSDVLNRKLKSVMKETQPETKQEDNPITSPDSLLDEKNKIITTDEEREAYVIIKVLLKDIVDPKLITLKDTINYCAFLYNNKVNKTICRLKVGAGANYISFADSSKEARIPISSVNDIFDFKQELTESVSRFL